MVTRPLSTISAGIQLRDILPSAKTVGCGDVMMQSACGQWNECQPQDIFVALAGADADGHDFAAEAVERGASAVVGERLMAVSAPQFIVEDSRTAFGKICQVLAGNPSQHLSTVGIAGSVGKTVTAHLIHSIFKVAGFDSGLSSTIETRFGRGAETAQPADRSPIIAEQLTNMALGDCTHAIIEASSPALAQHAFAGVELDTAVVTNIRRSNLDFHGSIENHRRAIARLIEYLKPTGFAIVNADDRDSQQLLDDLFMPTLTFGIHARAEVTARLIDRNRACQTFMLSAGSESMPVQTSIIGKQHIYNCLAAAAVGLTLGIELEVIARGLENATIPGRLERVECGQSYGVWIDSAITPIQLSDAISAVSRVCDGKLWCVCSTDASQSQADRRQIGEILDHKTEQPVITQSRIGLQTDYEPAHQILDGFQKPGTARVMPDRFNAIEWVLSQAHEGDCVLIAGCGEKPVALNSDSECSVTDRDFCQAWLYDHAAEKSDNLGRIYNIEDYR